MWRLLAKKTRAMSSRCDVDFSARSRNASLNAVNRCVCMRWLTAMVLSRASRLRCCRRITPSDHGAQDRGQEHLLEIAIGERRTEHLDTFRPRELPVHQDDVLLANATTTTARAISDVTQQL